MSGERGSTVEYVEDECTELGTPFLEVVRGAAVRPPVALAPGSVVIGRDDSADLAFAVEGVSRKHVRITLEPSGAATLFDLSSRNGTFVNGLRVESAPLRDGDEIRRGSGVVTKPIETSNHAVSVDVGAGRCTGHASLPAATGGIALRESTLYPTDGLADAMRELLRNPVCRKNIVDALVE